MHCQTRTGVGNILLYLGVARGEIVALHSPILVSFQLLYKRTKLYSKHLVNITDRFTWVSFLNQMAGCLRKQHITTCSINWFSTWKRDTKSRATLTPYFHCQLVEKSWWAQRSLNAKSHCHQPEDLNCQWILLWCRAIAHTQQMIKNIKQTLSLDTDCITFANTVLQLLGSGAHMDWCEEQLPRSHCCRRSVDPWPVLQMHSLLHHILCQVPSSSCTSVWSLLQLGPSFTVWAQNSNHTRQRL